MHATVCCREHNDLSPKMPFSNVGSIKDLFAYSPALGRPLRVVDDCAQAQCVSNGPESTSSQGDARITQIYRL